MKKSLCFIISCLALLLGSCGKDSASGTDTLTNGPGQGGSLARFAIAGDHLYAVEGNKLKVFDISNRSNPVYISNHQLNTQVETIFPRDSATIFIGTTEGMFIYDVSNAPNINLLSRYDHVVSCDPVVANNNFAYVTLHSDENSNRCFRNVNQLDIIDIRNLRQPLLVNSFTMIQPLGLGLYGDTLLVCDRGVKVLDVSNPNGLKLLNAIEDISARDIIPNGDIMII
ncbi:MAG: LVIVD repeat-containing protein [Owenweeksia sp.]